MKLLAVGPGGEATGFGRVFRSLLDRLAAHFEVTHFSPNPFTVATEEPYRVLPRQRAGDIFGRESLPGLLEEFDPDVVLLCHDPPFWGTHRETLLARKGKTGGRPLCVFYCPIEWPDVNPKLLRGLKDLDAVVLYTEFGRNVVELAFADGPSNTPRLYTIPHGVDTSTFHPVVDARQRLFPDLQDAFIVLNANRNCPRKRIDLTLQAFALFAGGKPDVRLYLHMGMKDSGIDVLALASELGIQDKLLLTHKEEMRPRISDEELNLIYNACDVGLNTSTGEGWGLVAFEHAATGAPQIVPDHSACRELWRKHGVLVPAMDNQVRPEDVAAAIERLYSDNELRQSLGHTGREYVKEHRFSWDVIADQWLRLLVTRCPSPL